MELLVASNPRNRRRNAGQHMTNKTVVSYSSNFTKFPQDSAFYVAGSGNCWIATVTHNGITTDICCDGEMRIHVWKDPAFVGDKYYDIWRYTED